MVSASTAIYGARQESYRGEILDQDDRLIRDLTEMTGGSLEQNSNRKIRGGGSVDLTFHGDSEIDWGLSRFKFYYSAEGQEWPLGVFLVEAPEDDHDDDRDTVDVTVTLLDKLAVLDQDAVPSSYSLDKGALITEAVRGLIESAGEDKIALTASGKTLPHGKVWDAGTSKLEIVNELLDMINYFALWVDGNGVYQAQPYVPPERRAIKHTFQSGEFALQSPGWSRKQDWFQVPNRVIMTSRSTQDEPAYVATAENLDPDSKFSYPRRGYRWITMVKDGVEVADQEELQAKASRQLRDSSTKVTNLSVDHAQIDLWPNDLVELVNPHYSGLATVTGYSFNLEHGSLVSATWREVEER